MGCVKFLRFVKSARACLQWTRIRKTLSGIIARILDLLIYFRIRHSFAHLRPMILPAHWSISRLQSWTCSSLPAVAEFVKLTQSIVIEIQRQSADLYRVQLCNRQFFVVSTAIYVVKVYECHPLDNSTNFDSHLRSPHAHWSALIWICASGGKSHRCL